MSDCSVYLLDQPGGEFSQQDQPLAKLGPARSGCGQPALRICQSDVIIYKHGLPRIKKWPAVLLHEVSAYVEEVGEAVTKFAPGDLVGIGCDLPCGDLECIYCGTKGTGDWTSCPNTHATGHEFDGFARTHAVLPDWFVELGPIVKFPAGFDPDLACQLEPLACCLEGMTRVNHCIENRIVVLVGAGSQSVYALQCAQAMNARKIIVVNRGAERLERVLRDFGDERTVGIRWDDNAVDNVLKECKPFNEPHFVMVNAPVEQAYHLVPHLMGYGTVLDAHAGVKGAGGKPAIPHTIDLNNDIHYRLQCYQATHGSSMRGINLAHQLLLKGKLPKQAKMTNASEFLSRMASCRPFIELRTAIA